MATGFSFASLIPPTFNVLAAEAIRMVPWIMVFMEPWLSIDWNLKWNRTSGIFDKILDDGQFGQYVARELIASFPAARTR